MMGENIHFHVVLVSILQLVFFLVIRLEISEKKHPSVWWLCIGAMLWLTITGLTVVDMKSIKNFIYVYLGVWIIIMNSVNRILFVLKDLPLPQPLSLSSSSSQRREEEEEEEEENNTTTRTFSIDHPPSYSELFPVNSSE